MSDIKTDLRLANEELCKLEDEFSGEVQREHKFLDMIKDIKLKINNSFRHVSANADKYTERKITQTKQRAKLAKAKPKEDKVQRTLIPPAILSIILHWNSKKSLPITRLSNVKGGYFIEDQTGVCRRSIKKLEKVMKGNFYSVRKGVCRHDNKIADVYIKRSIDRYAEFKEVSKRTRPPLEDFIYNRHVDFKKNEVLHKAPLLYFIKGTHKEALASIQSKMKLENQLEKMMFSYLCELAGLNKATQDKLKTSMYNKLVVMARKSAEHIHSSYSIPKGKDQTMYIAVNILPDCKKLMRDALNRKEYLNLNDLWSAVNVLQYKNSSTKFHKRSNRVQL